MTATKKGTSETRARNKEKWAKEGYVALLEEGPQALSVKHMASRLGTSRMPFYWAYESRDEWFESIFAIYHNKATSSLIEKVEAFDGDDAGKLGFFFKTLLVGTPSEADLPFRRWLSFEPELEELMAKIDEERVAYLAKLFVGTGVKEDEAKERAEASYFRYVGEMVGGKLKGLDGAAAEALAEKRVAFITK